jgi:hypothetical protein
MAETLSRGKKTNNRRRYPEGSSPRPDLSEMKRKDADERNAAWRALSSKEQLAELDRRRKAGKGEALRQRQRIARNAVKKDEAKAAAEVAPTAAPKVKAKDRKAAERAARPTK